ncbi:MAG: 2'-5' RNA ligase family protein [Chloroflexi bacterium]|uniref:2'-5' RNA ligase family protein n=1 Tax=Candidatus Chlorohelix allophototropha TaxID=3003348 RepID=A0A8T7M056_9CHLR|nr:2'-5' RNA ligase family protein [Chloroflexota bacterium]WJW67882.1 2'-5' RNA ligase family protein [Chloroflexota bacterium L227-S17]
MLTSSFTGTLSSIRANNEQEPQFAIILYAPTEVSTALDYVRFRYDPGFKMKIPPHITLKRPASIGKQPNLSAHFHTVCRAIEEITPTINPFAVALSGYDVFRKPDCNVVFLKIADASPLWHLHQKLIEVLSRFYPDGAADSLEGAKYHPHLTIGNKLSDIELAVLQHELDTGSYKLDFRFIAEEMGLLAQLPIADDRFDWRTISHFKFGSIPAAK